LGTFRKTGAKSDCWLRLVRSSVCPHGTADITGRIVVEFYIWDFLLKFTDIFRFHIKSFKNNRHFTCNHMHNFNTLRTGDADLRF